MLCWNVCGEFSVVVFPERWVLVTTNNQAERSSFRYLIEISKLEKDGMVCCCRCAKSIAVLHWALAHCSHHSVQMRIVHTGHQFIGPSSTTEMSIFHRIKMANA